MNKVPTSPNERSAAGWDEEVELAQQLPLKLENRGLRPRSRPYSSPARQSSSHKPRSRDDLVTSHHESSSTPLRESSIPNSSKRSSIPAVSPGLISSPRNRRQLVQEMWNKATEKYWWKKAIEKAPAPVLIVNEVDDEEVPPGSETSSHPAHLAQGTRPGSSYEC